MAKAVQSSKIRNDQQGRTVAVHHNIVRAPTKHHAILDLLRSSEGTTIAAIMSATGWQRHSVRGFLSGVVKRRLRLNLKSEQTDRGRVYRVRSKQSSLTKSSRSKSTA